MESESLFVPVVTAIMHLWWGKVLYMVISRSFKIVIIFFFLNFSANAKSHIPIFEVMGGFFNFHSESSSYHWRYVSNRWADTALRDLVQ